MEFVPEGDYVEQQEIVQAEDVPPEPIEDAELAIPLPRVMAPDAPPLPVKREEFKRPSSSTSGKSNKRPSPARRNSNGTPARPAATRKPAAICTRSASPN